MSLILLRTGRSYLSFGRSRRFRYGVLRFCERRFQAVEHGCGCLLRLVLPTGGRQCGAASALPPGFAVAVRGLASPLPIYLGNLAVAQANKSRVDSEPARNSVARDVDAFRRASDEPGGSRMPMNRL